MQKPFCDDKRSNKVTLFRFPVYSLRSRFDLLMIRFRTTTLRLLSFAVLLASVQGSVPLIKYIIFHEEYIHVCQVVLKHKEHQNGSCQLMQELALEQMACKNQEVKKINRVFQPEPAIIPFSVSKLHFTEYRVIRFPGQFLLVSNDKDHDNPPPEV